MARRTLPDASQVDPERLRCSLELRLPRHTHRVVPVGRLPSQLASVKGTPVRRGHIRELVTDMTQRNDSRNPYRIGLRCLRQGFLIRGKQAPFWMLRGGGLSLCGE